MSIRSVLVISFLLSFIFICRADTSNSSEKNTADSSSYVTVNSTKPFEEQVTHANTTYVIQGDVLLTRNFKIPDNCTLILNEGIILGNFVLEGTRTRIEAHRTRIFGNDITIKGDWSLDEAYCEWFGGSISNTDNSIAIQRCIDSFNLIYFGTGTYKIEKSIFIKKDKCVVKGVSTSRSVIQKTRSRNEEINAVFLLGEQKKNIQFLSISDLNLSAASYNVDYGIYTKGINSSSFRNLYIFQCRNGFNCNNEVVGSLWDLTFDNVVFNCNTMRGYAGTPDYGYKSGNSCAVTCITNGGAAILFNRCWVRDCATGFHLKGVNYCQMNCCAADNIQGTAYLFEFSKVSLYSCGMENVLTNTAIISYYSNLSFTGLEDYMMIAKNNGEVYRVKIDGGRVTFTNCYFTEWNNVGNNPNIYGVTSNTGAKVIMINTKQPTNINSFMALTEGASINYYE